MFNREKIISFNNSNVFFFLSALYRINSNIAYNLVLSIQIKFEKFFFEYLFLIFFLSCRKKEKIFIKPKKNSTKLLLKTNGKDLYSLLIAGIKRSRLEMHIKNENKFFLKYNFEKKKKNIFYLKDSNFKKIKSFSNIKNAEKSTNFFHEKLYMFFYKKSTMEKNKSSTNLLIWNTSKKINFE